MLEKYFHNELDKWMRVRRELDAKYDKRGWSREDRGFVKGYVQDRINSVRNAAKASGVEL